MTDHSAGGKKIGGHASTDRNAPPSTAGRRSVGATVGVGLVVGLGVVVGAVAGYASRRPVAGPTPKIEAPVSAAVAPRSSSESQIAHRRLSTWRIDEPGSLLAPVSDAGVLVPAMVLSPPYEVIASTVFDVADRRIRLAHVRPIGRTRVCRDASDRRFSCGLMGRAALVSALGSKPLTCRRLFLGPVEPGRTIEAECTTDAGDLSTVQVRRGFALPATSAGPHFDDALAEARAAGAGIWAGPAADTDDPVEAEIAAIPIGAAKKSAPTIEIRDEPPSRPRPTAATEPSAPKSRRAADRAREAGEKDRKIGPYAGTSRPVGPRPDHPPTLDDLAPNKTRATSTRAVAGPILPPPPGLAATFGGDAVSPSPEDADRRHAATTPDP